MKAKPTMTPEQIEAWFADMRTRAPRPSGGPYAACTHGTNTTYRSGCRCGPCKDAGHLDNLARRQRRKARLTASREGG